MGQFEVMKGRGRRRGKGGRGSSHKFNACLVSVVKIGVVNNNTVSWNLIIIHTHVHKTFDS